MVFKGAARLIVRLSRTLISKPIFTHKILKLNINHEIYSKYPTRFYLFPSIYRSFVAPINGSTHSNLIPFRIALNEIKRRLFFAGLFFFYLKRIKQLNVNFVCRGGVE